VKLGYGVYTDRPHIPGVVAQLGARVVLLFDSALQLAPAIRALCPDILIIGRKYFPIQSWNPDPYLAYTDGCNIADQLPISQYPDVDVWQSYNEAISNDDPPEKWAAYDMFERGFTDRIHYLGKKSIIGNIACGNGTDAQLLEMYPSMAKADYFGYHAYTSKETPGLIDQWYFNRYRSWIEEFSTRSLRFPPVILTEVGTYWPWKHPENYPLGECVELDPRPVFRSILEEMNTDWRIIGGCVFCLGDSGGWSGFDIDGEVDIMPSEGGTPMQLKEQFPDIHTGWIADGGDDEESFRFYLMATRRLPVTEANFKILGERLKSHIQELVNIGLELHP